MKFQDSSMLHSKVSNKSMTNRQTDSLTHPSTDKAKAICPSRGHKKGTQFNITKQNLLKSLVDR